MNFQTVLESLMSSENMSEKIINNFLYDLQKIMEMQSSYPYEYNKTILEHIKHFCFRDEFTDKIIPVILEILKSHDYTDMIREKLQSIFGEDFQLVVSRKVCDNVVSIMNGNEIIFTVVIPQNGYKIVPTIREIIFYSGRNIFIKIFRNPKHEKYHFKIYGFEYHNNRIVYRDEIVPNDFLEIELETLRYATCVKCPLLHSNNMIEDIHVNFVNFQKTYNLHNITNSELVQKKFSELKQKHDEYISQCFEKINNSFEKELLIKLLNVFS